VTENPYKTPEAPLTVSSTAGPRIIQDTLTRYHLLSSITTIALVEGYLWYRPPMQRPNYVVTLIFVCTAFIWPIAGSFIRRGRLRNRLVVPGTRALGYANGSAGGRYLTGILSLNSERLSFIPKARTGLPTLEIPLAEIQEIETKGTHLFLRRGPSRSKVTYGLTRPGEWKQAILEAKAASPLLAHQGSSPPPYPPQQQSADNPASYTIVAPPTWVGTLLMVGSLLAVGAMMLKKSLNSTGLLYYGFFAAFILAMTGKTTWMVRQVLNRLRNRPPVPASEGPLLGGWAAWNSGGKRQSGGAVLTPETFYLFPSKNWDGPDWKIQLSDVESVALAGSELKLRLRSLRSDFKCRVLSAPQWKEEFERLLPEPAPESEKSLTANGRQ